MTKIATREFNQKIGYRLYLRRKMLKLTQKNIAELLHVSFQCVQKYERGQIALSLYNLYKLASFLSVDISYFFQETESDKQSKIKKQDLRLQILLKNFANIKDKKVAQNIEDLICELSNEN